MIKLRRVLALHPALITIAYLAYMAITVTSANAAYSVPPKFFLIVLEVVVATGIVLLTGAWIYAAARVSADRLGDGRRGLLIVVRLLVTAFLVSGVISMLLIHPYRLNANSETVDQILAPAVGVTCAASYFAAAWVSSALIVKAELEIGKHSSTFVTFLLFLYFMFGVWALKPRMSRLLASNAVGDRSAGNVA